MAYYRSMGDVPPVRHTQHRAPSGALYREELMGEEGFSSDSSLLYHVGVPSALVDAREWVAEAELTLGDDEARDVVSGLAALAAAAETAGLDLYVWTEHD